MSSGVCPSPVFLPGPTLHSHPWGRVSPSISGNPLDVDPQDHRALDGLSEAYIGMQRNEGAAEHALKAVGLVHHLPSGHFHLGIALARLQQLDRAVQAFDHCIAMAPRNAEARRWKNKVQDLATVG